MPGLLGHLIHRLDRDLDDAGFGQVHRDGVGIGFFEGHDVVAIHAVVTANTGINTREASVEVVFDDGSKPPLAPGT